MLLSTSDTGNAVIGKGLFLSKKQNKTRNVGTCLEVQKECHQIFGTLKMNLSKQNYHTVVLFVNKCNVNFAVRKKLTYRGRIREKNSPD